MRRPNALAGILGLAAVFGGLPAAPADAPAATLTPAPAAEVVLGQQSLDRFLASRPLSQDGALALRVGRVGYALARVSDRPDIGVQFLVVVGLELQGYSFTGGTVCLTDRLARLYDSDDELAFVIAHELAHVTLRHTVSEGVFEQALLAGRADDPGAARSLHAQTAELEADRYGALYACRAGYRVSAALDALDRLDRAAPGREEDARHPAYAERLTALGRLRAELDRSVEAFARGKLALAGGRVDEAVDMLKLFTASFPQSVAGQVNLGSAFLARARSKGGVPAELEEVVPFLPDPGVAVRGEVPAVDVQRAQEHFRKALALQPDEPIATIGLALALLRLGDFSGAQDHLLRLAGRNGSDADVILCLGNADYLAGDPLRAAERYRKALELHPGWPAATKNLALALAASGDVASARAFWESLLDDPALGGEARRRLAAPH